LSHTRLTPYFSADYATFEDPRELRPLPAAPSQKGSFIPALVVLLHLYSAIWTLTAFASLLPFTHPSARSRLLVLSYPVPSDPGGGSAMDISERRHLTRYNHRTPLRFRAVGLASDRTEHFTEALNISRGGFYFAPSAPLQVGMPIEATIRI